MTQQTTGPRKLALIAASGSILLAGGCKVAENETTTVGQTIRPEAIAQPYVPSDADRVARAGADPSQNVIYDTMHSDPGTLRGLNRTHWAASYVVLPTDGLAHRPTYRFRETGWETPGGIYWWTGEADTALAEGREVPNGWSRRHGVFPTPLTALETGGRGAWGEIGYGFATGLGAVGELGWMPIAAILDHPYEVKHSPRWSYERTPSDLETETLELGIDEPTPDAPVVAPVEDDRPEPQGDA
ncbi:MAG: hypothetical protein AAGG07_05215 [Planctomycetota bacterium]